MTIARKAVISSNSNKTIDALATLGCGTPETGANPVLERGSNAAPDAAPGRATCKRPDGRSWSLDGVAFFISLKKMAVPYSRLIPLHDAIVVLRSSSLWSVLHLQDIP